jgi:hypothetical protein
MEVAPGHVLQTDQGKAEMLLFPGAFVRLGENSSVRMVSPSLTDTRVELVKGQAMVEVDQISKDNHLQIQAGPASIEVQKKGIYSLNADQPRLAVYDGKASVRVGDRSVEAGKGREVLLADASLKAQKFDRDQTDQLYAWSRLRSEYSAEANMSSAEMVVGGNYPGRWGGTGWYWNPSFSTWAFVPGAGYFDSPFGFGFYSPAYWYYNPPLFYYNRPGAIWRGPRGGVVARGPVAVPNRVAPGRPAPGIGSQPAFHAAPSMPAMRAPAGGHFSGGRGR